MGRTSIEINQGNLRSVNVAQAGERTRAGAQPEASRRNYRAQLDGKALLIVIDSAGACPPRPAQHRRSRVSSPRAANRDPLPLRDIDFRRGPDGAGRVIVDLANNQVGVDIRQQGKSLVVEFLRSTLPDSLRRRLDVTDFGTPVQTVSTFQSGDRVRMVIEPRGAWEHSAYQSDNQFVLEVRPQKVDPNKLTQGPGYQGEKLSLNFQNIEVRALLQVIADFTNFNVVTSDTVTGSRDAAAEGRALGPGAGHHPAGQGPGHAQERQRDLDRAEGRDRGQGEGRARGRRRRSRARAAAHAVVPAQLHQGRGGRRGP